MIADTIKRAVDAVRVAEYYGYKANKEGFTRCPFHNEKTASLKLYKGTRGWYCYGCAQWGSVIDFVMKLFNINFSQAIVRLNHDFRLNIVNEKPDIRKSDSLRRKHEEEERRSYLRKLVDEYVDIEIKKNYIVFHDTKPKEPFEELSDEFIEAMCRLNELEDYVQRRWESVRS